LFPTFKDKELSGFENNPQAKPSLTLNEWLDGDYQTKMQRWLNDSCGFHNDFIRLRNQIFFSLYRISPNENVIVGKSNCLYSPGYIESINGYNYLGEDSIYRKTEVIKMLSDTLAKRGQRLIIMFAPGKGSFFPELVPQQYFKHAQPKTNHATYIEACKHYNVEYIDLLSWFVAMKDTSAFPLYPLTGVHWSKYGQIMVIDSLVKYFTYGTGCNNYVKINSLNPKMKPEEDDNDIEKNLNLIFALKTNTPLAYPSFSIHIDSNFHRQKMIAVADSYWFGIFSGLKNRLFKEDELWYYYDEIQTSDSTAGIYPHLRRKDINYFERLDKAEVIIVLNSDCNLRYLGGDYKNQGYGIIEDLYERFFGQKQIAKH
jgi:hypothetical protein